MIFQKNNSNSLSSPLTLCVIGFCSLMIFQKSMDVMLMNNFVNNEYSKLYSLKRNLNHEKKSLEVNLDKMNLSDSEKKDSKLESSDVKKIELINKLEDWSNT